MASGKPVVSDQDYQGQAKLIRPVLAQPAQPPSDAQSVPGEFWLDPVTGLLTFRGLQSVVEPTDRAAHHGTQPVESIAGFDDAVRATRLDELAAPTAPVQFNGQPAQNLGAPVNQNDAARMTELGDVLQYTNNLYTPVELTLRALTGAAMIHVPALVAITDAWDFPTLPATLDGVYHDGSLDKPVLVLGQSAQENNGIWYPVPNATEAPYWRRVSHFTNAAGDVVELPELIGSGTVVHVAQGTHKGRFFTYNNDSWQSFDDGGVGSWSRLISSNDSANDLYPPRENVFVNGKRLISVAPSVDPSDAVVRSELDAVRIALESQQQGSSSRTLDQIPTAVAPVDLGAQKLTNVADGVAAQDAIVLHQLDDAAQTLRDEAATARSEIDAAIASSDAAIAAAVARTLDQIPTAAATVNLGGQELQNLAAPTTGGSAATRAYVDAAQTATQARTLDQVPAPVAAVDMNSQRLRNVGAPAEDSDAVSRGYVRALLVGMDWKPNADAAADADVPLSGLGTVGGVQLEDGYRVLAPLQSDPTQRLIYIARAGAWDVAPDSGPDALSAGTTIAVTRGTGRGVWRLLTTDPITVGTTNLSWEPLPIADYTASDGVRREGIDFRADWTKAAKWFATDFGNTSATQYVIGHGIGHAISVSVWEIATGELLDARVVNDPTTGLFATVHLSAPPGNNAYRFVATGGALLLGE